MSAAGQCKKRVPLDGAPKTFSFRDIWSNAELVEGKTEAQELLGVQLLFLQRTQKVVISSLTTETNCQLSELPSQD